MHVLVLDAGNRVVYVGGAFGSLGSEVRQGLGAVSTTGAGATTAWDPNATGVVGDDVRAVALSADRSELFAGGVESGVARLKSFSTAGAGAVSTWTPVVDRPVVALDAADDGSLFVGSTFNDSGITDQDALMEFAPSSALDLPVVAIGDGSVVEGAGGEQLLRLTVSLSRPVSFPVSVYTRTTTGPATAGTDYLPSAGWVTIPAGATSAPATLTVRGDTTVEATEFVRVQLSDPGGAWIGRGTGIATITDDDPSAGRRGRSATPAWSRGTRAHARRASTCRSRGRTHSRCRCTTRLRPGPPPPAPTSPGPRAPL